MGLFCDLPVDPGHVPLPICVRFGGKQTRLDFSLSLTIRHRMVLLIEIDGLSVHLTRWLHIGLRVGWHGRLILPVQGEDGYALRGKSDGFRFDRFRQPAPVDFPIKTGCHIGGNPCFQVPCDAFDPAFMGIDRRRLSISVCNDGIRCRYGVIAFGKQGVFRE